MEATVSLTCRKIYRDIPFAHRQHRHDGHCALIHGHNWSFAFTFACREPDANGFVVDFGKLGALRSWIDRHFDHACVFNEDDPEREALVAVAPGAWKTTVVSDCSCEGLARHLYAELNPVIHQETNGRAWIASVEVEEDSRNSACYTPETGD